jgi:hypothetical protein
MKEQPRLTEEDWRLVLELLDREYRDLHPEIRHSQTTSVREELQQRLRRVEHLSHTIRESLDETG